MSEVITENLIRVARKLQELDIDDVVFVGGATIGLFLTDPAAPAPRATLDIDVVTPVTSRAAYYRLEDKLRAAGFTQPMGAPICRWLIGEDEVDIMPSDVEILGFSNRWYPALLDHACSRELPDGTIIQLVSPPYLVATKLEAFHGRGQNDYWSSHDLEDIIVLLDGRAEIVEDLGLAPEDVRGYIVDEFRKILGDEDFVEAISGHLAPDDASQARASIVLERMRLIVEGTTRS